MLLPRSCQDTCLKILNTLEITTAYKCLHLNFSLYPITEFQLLKIANNPDSKSRLAPYWEKEMRTDSVLLYIPVDQVWPKPYYLYLDQIHWNVSGRHTLIEEMIHEELLYNPTGTCFKGSPYCKH